MPFRTKLDYSDNRQIKQHVETRTELSGTTVFGVPFSALTTGATIPSGVTQTYNILNSTFSGNSGTTIYSWFDSRMILGESTLSAITPSNSGTTQYTGPVFIGSSFSIIDGNTFATAYTGVSFNILVTGMTDLGGGNYSGDIVTNSLTILSASSLDFTGRTIWVDVPAGITRTQDLIITRNPIIGNVWTCIDSEGKGGWSASSGATGTSSTTTGATLIGSVAYFDTNAVLSAYTLNLSALTTDIWTASTGTPSAVLSGGTSVASGNFSVAEGDSTVASGYASHAEGIQTTALGDGSHVEGSGTTASGQASHSEGYYTTALGNYGSHSEGGLTTASGDLSHSEGQSTTALGGSSHAEGQLTIATGGASHAEGYFTKSIGDYSHAEGRQTTALGDNSHAEGNLTTASGLTSHAEGYNTTAIGDSSHAEGYGSISSGPYCHAEGQGTIASVQFSHAEGFNTQALAGGCHAEGGFTTANADWCHAEGLFTIATGYASHAEGEHTYAGGVSHAEGSYTTASGAASHAEGARNTASGWWSHVGGQYSESVGNHSFVHGSASTANGTSTIVLGSGITGNTNDTTYVDNLNIKTVGGGPGIIDLGIDAGGNVVDQASDIKLKENINTIENALTKVLCLRGVTYNWKDREKGGNALKLGFIAQEVNDVVPELAYYNPNGDYMGVHYKDVTALLVEAIKELSQGVTTSNNTHLETQTILAEDNNIELNYSGNQQTALGGGIRVLHAKGQDLASEIITDENGDWVTNNDFKSKALTIPIFTPASSSDINGNEGNITRDDNYLYVKTVNGWKRSNLESF